MGTDSLSRGPLDENGVDTHCYEGSEHHPLQLFAPSLIAQSFSTTLTCDTVQILDPSNTYIVHQTAVSAGDHSFDAKSDGKHLYCFSNENWSATTKEVSFNVHGIVYVPESDAPQDPLENEGTSRSVSAMQRPRSVAVACGECGCERKGSLVDETVERRGLVEHG